VGDGRVVRMRQEGLEREREREGGRFDVGVFRNWLKKQFKKRVNVWVKDNGFWKFAVLVCNVGIFAMTFWFIEELQTSNVKRRSRLWLVGQLA
jgi:hypothetical protein